MPKKATTDHGEIIHFAGRRRLFPVASRADATQIRLAYSRVADHLIDEGIRRIGEDLRTGLEGK